MTKLCIMYLTDSIRPFAFPHFVKHFSQCKYLYDIELLVLSHEPNLEFHDSLLKNTSIRYKLALVPQDRNYLRKIAVTLDYMKQNNIPYLMKHDNDILMSSFVYDYLYENLECLENPSNLLLTPTLTSGIPTCDRFIEDYCNEEEKTTLGRLFLQYEHGPLWGTDYTELNKYTTQATEWNPDAYFKGVKQREHHYKGIHPVRMLKEAILQLNAYVVKYKERIFSKDNYSLVYDNTTPYFCNSVFCIQRSTYETIVQRQDLYVDNFDEVPLNKWRDMFQLNLVLVKNGTAVHPIYNTIDNYIELEKQLLTQL